MRCTEESSPTFRNCVFLENEAGGGGAVYCDGLSHPHFEDCRFRDNAATGDTGRGGAVFAAVAAPAFLRCSFVGNTAVTHGGAARFYDEEPRLESCEFCDNTASLGGALACLERTSTRVMECLFDGNTATQGGAVWADHYTAPLFERCTFHGNDATDGGCLHARNQAQVTLENSIIAFGTTGAAVTCDAGTATLTCCDLYGNAGGDWVGCIAGQFGQAGNIAEDPLFCDAVQGDFRLDSASPCVPFTPPNPECDRLGAFAVGCGPGAVEPGEPIATRLELRRPYPNPFRTTAHVDFVVPTGHAERRVTVEVLDLSGRCVRRLAHGGQGGGPHRVHWDGTDDRGCYLPGGLYFVRLTGRSATRVRSVLLVR